MLVPACLMVSTIRFRSFKTIDLQKRRSYKVLVLLALVIAVIQLHPNVVLLGARLPLHARRDWPAAVLGTQSGGATTPAAPIDG